MGAVAAGARAAPEGAPSRGRAALVFSSLELATKLGLARMGRFGFVVGVQRNSVWGAKGLQKCTFALQVTRPEAGFCIAQSFAGFGAWEAVRCSR